MLTNRIMALAIGALVLGFAAPASALLSFTLDDSFGSDPVSGVIIITLAQVDPQNVTLDINLTALNTTEYIDQLYLNTSGSVITDVSGSGLDSFSYTDGAHKADGDGFHDLFIDFLNNEADRLEGGSTYSFNLEGTGGLLEGDFNEFGTLSDKGQFHAVAKINATGDGRGSDWVGDGNGVTQIPEPNAALLFAIGAATVGARVRRR